MYFHTHTSGFHVKGELREHPFIISLMWSMEYIIHNALIYLTLIHVARGNPIAV